MKPSKSFALMCAAALAGLPACSAAPPDETPTPEQGGVPRVRHKVLVVHSYDSQYEWVKGLQRGIDQVAFENPDMHFETYFMDTKRKDSKEWMKKAGEIAMEIVQEWQPEVVLTSDDNAQEFFAKKLIGHPKIKVVFCGVNAEPEDYNFPAANVTGILQRPPFVESLARLTEVAPKAKRLAVVMDSSTTADGALKFFKSVDKKHRVVEWAQPETRKEWEKTIKRLNKHVDAVGFYSYQTVKDEDGKPVDPRELMRWTIEHLEIPTFSPKTNAIDDGALVGVAESAFENGAKAARWSAEIARGKPVSDFPITAAVKGQSMINLETVQSLELEVSPKTLQSFDVRVGAADLEAK
ncbi:MAG: ABC transporter substrate binding protein [Polyangiaceae bacterium]